MPDQDAMPASTPVPGAGSPPMPAPQATPQGEPQEPKGDAEVAKSNIHVAISMLEQSLSSFGSQSEEGQAVLKALATLAKKFSGNKSEEIVPAQVADAMAGLPDDYKKIMQQSKPGGKPAGAPPGM